ncbi:type IV pilin [Halanaeroarchaeum sulfurireducens]|uniref:Archaeal Type IV pilin N-terminal domain-containing protein n=1 Tax=Halanaeroarchaeum sulfurireducens TaxID=1604004 RepID=A0A0F7P7J5_9EURY|nr:type IV pilin [Halanaeroarchaeum sulfurireducens]AKH96662.1 hypothetical protein HLASF_0148 [Halanaeroarchaeum sulfurireducens]ALG81064.1 hypothetical protein HLASA_0148 [Halanaeroarchaeum sulfurireducens]
MPSELSDDNRDERATTPVVGIVLLVALTVILAAVLGSFVFGFGENLNEPAPTAQISLSDGGDAGEVNVSHQSGDAISFDDVSVIADGSTVTATTPGELEAGEGGVITITEGGFNGSKTEIQLRHDPSNSIIARGTVTVGDNS